MRLIPIGYSIVDGKAVVNPDESRAVNMAFELYLSGESLINIGKKTGINRSHAGIANILEDSKYLGTDFYPQVVDQELFDKVQRLRKDRRKAHARPERKHQEAIVQTEFIMKKGSRTPKNPFERAQYRYEQIKPKEEKHA